MLFVIIFYLKFLLCKTVRYDSFITKFNTDLANTLGNLVNRSIAMTNKYFGGSVKAGENTEECDNELIKTAKESIEKYYNKISLSKLLFILSKTSV